MTIELEPMGERIIAKQFDDDKIGSIYVPETAKQVSLRATVVAAGPDCIWVKPGDIILFGKYAKFDVPLRGEKWRDHFIMNEPDVLCKLRYP
jgi:co-chaperonin GroES (HSP10)